VSLIPVAIKSRRTTGVNNTGGEIAVGINDTMDTGGKFATCVVDTGGAR
jgi:hypothetical protein